MKNQDRLGSEFTTQIPVPFYTQLEINEKHSLGHMSMAKSLGKYLARHLKIYQQILWIRIRTKSFIIFHILR